MHSWKCHFLLCLSSEKRERIKFLTQSMYFKIRFCLKRHILKSFLTKVCQKAHYNRVKVSLLSTQWVIFSFCGHFLKLFFILFIFSPEKKGKLYNSYVHETTHSPVRHSILQFPKKATTTFCHGFCLHPYSMQEGYQSRQKRKQIILVDRVRGGLVQLNHTFL